MAIVRSETRDCLSALLSAVADELAARIGRVLLRQLRGDDPDLVDQSRSQLGPRAHIAAVRRRISEGSPGASIHGRRYLLSQEAYREEIERPKPLRGPGVAKARPRPLPPEDELEQAWREN